MRCFEVTEKVTPGLLIHRDRQFPYIMSPDIFPTGLHNDIADFIPRLPPGEVRLQRTTIAMSGDVLMLKPPSNRGQDQALVRICHPAPERGVVRLTAADFTWKSGGRVYESFPPRGVQVVAPPDQVPRLVEGVDDLDVFLILSPRARVRICRTGDLGAGADKLPPELFVRWDGRALTLGAPQVPVSHTRVLKFDTRTGQPFDKPIVVEYAGPGP